ncbi:hypothetical protein P152DRAFT_454503 [Eremomyces bilateralis CBS 781.70]|uniref:Glycine zipper 2TM domain-containing protein n=1 Tax=Eremomyces bilateralis CBS 781.70 TaxID=1392243 RepID=A0A6G1GDY4_9PEZI|nr:uncharacterized protein P152DRAFT_454503 [Eremomyces bilateralis CBS 781.70]KAF1816242.1 hypothetical protein P152DRAFT_454503 [Eremomyces bilateralis CBS 781.70]
MDDSDDSRDVDQWDRGRNYARDEYPDDRQGYDRSSASVGGQLSHQEYPQYPPNVNPQHHRDGGYMHSPSGAPYPPDDQHPLYSTPYQYPSERSAMATRDESGPMRYRTTSVPPGYHDRHSSPYEESRPHRKSRPDRPYDDEYHRRRRTRSASRRHKSDDLSLGASLAGALAGGWVGHELGKGDSVATAAGVLIGALGAAEADKMYDKHKEKDRREEKDWEEKWATEGRRY